ncbi:hypothetical protein E2C01_079078 [Portunus trituberculatus]|uniref:Uncharacterized protein n=1 Tax=Portunus trituberculatus TaxID=210409 RepID=A0A5B7IG17_PORTR|nr:hypothetical protein [Portunus trituberculatus]
MLVTAVQTVTAPCPQQMGYPQPAPQRYQQNAPQRYYQKAMPLIRLKGLQRHQARGGHFQKGSFRPWRG